MVGRLGFCGFCGGGDGYLGEQGDETSEILPATVRTGDGPDTWAYAPHDNALPGRDIPQQIQWCGCCIAGLRHKFQRLDDHNLRAKLTAYRLWQEMDGVRWSVAWPPQDATGADEPEPGRFAVDDWVVHMNKIFRDRDIEHMEAEMARRMGADLQAQGWIDTEATPDPPDDRCPA